MAAFFGVLAWKRIPAGYKIETPVVPGSEKRSEERKDYGLCWLLQYQYPPAIANSPVTALYLPPPGKIPFSEVKRKRILLSHGDSF